MASKAAAFSHIPTLRRAMGSVGIPANFTLEPEHATAAIFGLSVDSLVDWADARFHFCRKKSRC
jgi:hypothetical protein